ncbi:MAG TPA: hypothetical protein VNW71_21980 [Thermoanaerobaculia bacterium]|nr:hypothetical protein [Thermoanaerobaculia bacterium]
MKRIILAALLLAAVAASASAENYQGNNGVTYSGPNRNAPYQCFYTNYSGPAVDGGISYWTLFTYQDASGKPMPRGTEHFQSTQVPWDGFKATWAKPVILQEPQIPLTFTRWEYTFNPSGPQCKRADVRFGGFQLVFSQCGDGHSRTCWLVQ